MSMQGNETLDFVHILQETRITLVLASVALMRSQQHASVWWCSGADVGVVFDFAPLFLEFVRKFFMVELDAVFVLQQDIMQNVL